MHDKKMKGYNDGEYFFECSGCSVLKSSLYIDKLHVFSHI